MDFNQWFLTLPKERQEILANDKWMLASSAFEAGQDYGDKHEMDLQTFENLEAQISRLHLTIKYLREHMVVDDEYLKSIIQEKSWFEAIKEYRSLTGLGLKEAKYYIDNLRAELGE